MCHCTSWFDACPDRAHAPDFWSNSAHRQAALNGHRVDIDEPSLQQIVDFEQMAKSHQCGGVGHAAPGKVDVHEIAQRLRVGDCVFHGFVGQTVPLLNKVHAQHFLQADRRTAALVASGVVRFDHLDESRRRHYPSHPFQEDLALRALFLLVALSLDKTDLAWWHWLHLSVPSYWRSRYNVLEIRLVASLDD